ncbi:MAG TPA: type II CAAX endopeptidase family protein [Bacteroidota bacterium]|nr:type II CAAX endopeptidase family protein [Bacteroidota bacterium]
MKNIFYNEAEQNIRAGWRMGIFALAFFGASYGFAFPVKMFLPHDVLLPGIIKGQIVVYGALFFVTWLVAKYLEHRPALASVGFPLHERVGREIWQGLLIGGGMMTFIFATEYGLGMVTLSFKHLTMVEAGRMFAASGTIFIIGAFGEELLFRGYLFQTMVEGTGKIIAVLAFAAFFGFAHSSNPNVTFFSLVNVALAGVWLAIAYFKTRTLWFPIALHFSWNFMQNHVFSFPVSGIQFGKYQLGVLVQSGPNWLTGGTFGPEGGALATLLLLVSGSFIYFSDWIRPSERAWDIERWREERRQSAQSEQPAVIDPGNS